MTKRELRRLAYRAPRNPALLPILHDALLEVYPAFYERQIEVAEMQAASEGWKIAIFFKPRGMGKHESLAGLFTPYFAVPRGPILGPGGLIRVYKTRAGKEG